VAALSLPDAMLVSIPFPRVCLPDAD